MTGEEWVAKYCAQRGLDWDKLDLPQRRAITRAIPCAIRCWRVGTPVDVAPGERCPECGRWRGFPTALERVLSEPDLV